MAYQYILFDMDGTLCDPGPGITDSVKYALAEIGIDETSDAALRRFIGPPLAVTFKEVYGFDEAKAARAIMLYRDEFQKVGIAKYIAYPGMADLLARLRDDGKILAVATSKADHFTHQILNNTGLIDYFTVIAAPKLDELHMTKGEVIKAALTQLGNPPHSGVVMVGDREQDVVGAQENQLDSIGVRFGYAEHGELERAGATMIADTAADLARYI